MEGVIEGVCCVYAWGLAVFFKFPFLMVIFYICILACFLPRNIPMEEDLSCELVWNKLQKSADTFPCYLGSMLVKLEGLEHQVNPARRSFHQLPRRHFRVASMCQVYKKKTRVSRDNDPPFLQIRRICQLPAFGGIQSNGLGYSADNQNDAFLDIS